MATHLALAVVGGPKYDEQHNLGGLHRQLDRQRKPPAYAREQQKSNPDACNVRCYLVSEAEPRESTTVPPDPSCTADHTATASELYLRHSGAPAHVPAARRPTHSWPAGRR